VSTRTDPSSKLAFVLLLWVCAFTLPWIVQASLCLVVIVLRFAVPDLQPQSPRSEKAFSRFIVYAITVSILVVLLNGLLIRGGNVLPIYGVSFHSDGLLFGLKTASRLLLLSFSILLFFISTPLPQFIRYLQQKGLPPYLALVLLLTLHFIDQLPSRIHQIFLAQQARGAPVDSGMLARTKALLSILSPLVLSSIVESIERGTALELRGFLSSRRAIAADETAHARAHWLTVLFLLLSLLVLAYSLGRWLIE
jgi:energy-coupling factor transport system permease protein